MLKILSDCKNESFLLKMSFYISLLNFIFAGVVFNNGGGIMMVF